MHDFRETYKTENEFTSTFITKNKRRSIMRQILRQKILSRDIADGRATESLCSATKTFSHTIKQLLHQYHKVLALCKLVLLEYCTQPIFCGIDAITDKYYTIILYRKNWSRFCLFFRFRKQNISNKLNSFLQNGTFDADF